MESVKRSREALQIAEGNPQECVDRLTRAIGKVVFDNAEILEKMAVEESEMGSYEDELHQRSGGATSTLGYGTSGNNSISENLTFKHLLNITRIARPIETVTIPTDRKLWGAP